MPPVGQLNQSASATVSYPAVGAGPAEHPTEILVAVCLHQNADAAHLSHCEQRSNHQAQEPAVVGRKSAWDVYWRREITEQDIQHEMDRGDRRG